MASHLKIIFSLVVFLIFGGITVALWQNQNNHERELVLNHTVTTAEQVRIRIEGLMNAQMASLKLMAERWVERDPSDFSQQRFLQFAESVYYNYPGFMGINWISPEGVIRWVYPPQASNKKAKGKNVRRHSDYGYRATFEKVAQYNNYAATPSVELFQGGLGFDTFWALVHDDELQGYLNGVFQIKHIMDVSLAKELFKKYWIRIYEFDRLIYLSEVPGESDIQQSRLYVRREIKFTFKTWQLEIEPKPFIYNSAATGNLQFLAFGLAISTVMALLTYSLLKRMQMYRIARDSAFHEISERKRTERKLANNEKRLVALLAEIEKKNEELETFLYTVSHDLKTPLVTIEGYIGALREDFGNLLTQDGNKHLNYMNEASFRMKNLLEDLLELSRIGRLNEEKAAFSFTDLVEEVVAEFQPQVAAQGIEVNIQEGLSSIYAERKRMRQVMENLLSNAIKYMGDDNSAPRIDIGSKKQNGGEVFFVQDNGIGIEERYFDKIFQVFQRLPSTQKNNEGTGVGLTIIKRIIEHHGGKIWLESKPGEGSTFFFTLRNKENL
ncbi:MAG: GHKL domain-containing protein [Deltaproteobacteria bacterium]|nr:GHKL domain-containing protein [Deltaproteobacteria bacterium]MBW2051450.1 GHKL domain-containing protein [Deltaproteobacteria bacterium]MBW2140678.1 GHKL domain-containing protein [Deltaproteobacteria bacterium]MBW2322638.1 GHKL domain-containing protein [Deltaproteobacteria bacterium]